MSLLASFLERALPDVQHLLEIVPAGLVLAGFLIVYPVTVVRDQLARTACSSCSSLYMANPMTAVVVTAQRAIYVHPVVTD